MGFANSSKRVRNSDLRVDPEAHPGWATDGKRIPAAGETVYCTEGTAQVVRVVGKTSDGSRLLELRLLDREAPPFYASASNVLQSEKPAGKKDKS
jgi:hypothetical protein